MLRVCGTDTQPSAARYEVLEFFICWTGLMGGKRGVQLQDSAPETIRHWENTDVDESEAFWFF